ncbi:MAG TPA: iron-sulfur cluster assembly accessory protein [Geminicoccus sp.]|jgi:iron-sulfur cluster assembly protein|uniref:HesB/IscA family protein n=1 Tax=Geminicoccus sp. TaxID=2024832 RepID=UPI002E3315F7|nr:iron-sulfur cluster assembly accessory protein [Geminicoccus sp.]HEX2525881.1 iron-sulfur cluster assembly accessory protein [Geminicoccus sp.]
MAQALSITQRAADRAKELLATQADAAGIKLAVKPRGCSGWSYSLDFAREIAAADQTIEVAGVTFVIDSSALQYVNGTEVDFVEDKLGSSFVFNNPNEKGRCGCGESFHV